MDRVPKNKLAKSLSKSTKFNKEECKRLLDLHQRIVTHKGRITLQRFGAITRVIFEELLDTSALYYLFRAFDVDNKGFIGPEDWVRGFSSTLRDGTNELCKIFETITASDKRRARDRARSTPKNTDRCTPQAQKIPQKVPKSKALKKKVGGGDGDGAKKGNVKKIPQKKDKSIVERTPEKIVEVIPKETTKTKPSIETKPCAPTLTGLKNTKGRKYLETTPQVLKNAWGLTPTRMKELSKSVAVIKECGGLEKNACRSPTAFHKFTELQNAYGIYWNGRSGPSRQISIVI